MNVLRNLDLLELIFSYLAIPNTKFPIERRLSKTGQQGLLHAGLTCKAFFEPAMNLLWYEMNSLLPLLLAIPLVKEEEEIYVRSYDNFFLATARLRISITGSDVDLGYNGGGPLSLQILCKPDKVAAAGIFHGKCIYPHLYGHRSSIPGQGPFSRSHACPNPFLGRHFERELPLSSLHYSLAPFHG
jgi:hypothetical protein